jgi:hypothetical protein
MGQLFAKIPDADALILYAQIDSKDPPILNFSFSLALALWD